MNKKQYTTPMMDVVQTCTTSMVCVSIGFGDGDTPVMHTRNRVDLDFEDDLWDEYLKINNSLTNKIIAK